MMDQPNLAAMRATTPERYSVQARAENAPFAPVSDVTGGAGLFWIQMGSQIDEEPRWNALYPHYRDVYLQKFARSEPMLASAIYSMATRISGLNYQLNGPPRAKKFASEMLTKPGLGDSLNTLIQKGISDLHTADNGVFVELWRGGNPAKPAGNRPVVGFGHLDSRQCWRSFDPEFPVWYTNPITHQIHKIPYDRVAFTSDNPQPNELARGIGFCATSRVLRMARVFKNMQIFLDEKVGGRFNRAIGAVSGVNPQQLKAALEQSNAQADAKGFVVYKDIPFLVSPNMEKGNEIKIMLQDLASLPDGFVFRDDADLYAYILAFCFGVDAREFWPATESGATKADATVQNMKARGRGIGNDIELMEGLIRKALPESVTFEFDFTDDEQDRTEADLHKVIADTHKVYVDMGAINAQEARALAISQGILDGEVLATNNAPLTSDDNPDTPDNMDAGDTTDGGAPELAPQTLPTKAKTFSGYRRSIRELTRGLWTGDLSKFDFVDGMVNAINRQFENAWQEVEREYNIGPDERTETSQDRLTLTINTEISYLTGFADAIADGNKANGGDLGPLMDRAELWANGYDRTKEVAQLVIGPDVKLVWKLGQTETHCDDCLQYSNKVFFKSQWDAAGVRPKMWELQCTGLHCDCEFEQTDARKTRGSVPALIGHKHHGATAA